MSVQWWPEDIKACVDRVAAQYSAENIAGTFDEEAKSTVLRDVMRQHSTPDSPMEEPFFLVDLGMVEHQVKQWIDYLPRVRPFYAYKCNGSDVLVDTLVALGCGFDCASKPEFEHVLTKGLHPENDIIFANPCKQVSHIKAAKANGLKYVTFDNEWELPKIKKDWPDAKVVLRIATDDSQSVCEFSSKYGAQMGYVPKLIDVCSDLGLNLVGVSFHVGSGCGDAGAFVASARDARRVFDMAEEKGFDMRFLDIGGGFPGDKESRPSFPEIATQLAPVLDDLFPPSVSIIAEPGRYFACAAYTLAANIFAKREIAFQEEGEETETQEMQYYLNEGVYQSFNCLFFDHAVVEAKPFFMDPSDEAEAEVKKTCTTIFGPTCDGLDCIAKRIEFPQMKLGDWMVFHDFGAYTVAAASKFNGFNTTKFHHVRSES